MKVDGAKLRAIRESKLLTLDEVSKDTGIKKDTIWRIEAGKTQNPKEHVLRKIGELFKMKPEEFSEAIRAESVQGSNK